MTVDLVFDDRGMGPPLVVLHGLFGAKRNWASIAKALAPRHRVLTVDLRNHGASPWNAVHDYPALAGDVALPLLTTLATIGRHCSPHTGNPSPSPSNAPTPNPCPAPPARLQVSAS